MGETVLICDDDEGILEVTKLYLELEGFKVIALKNCAGFFDTLIENRPDVVLMDIWMPNIWGDQVTKELKADPVLHNIPVLLFSANPDIEKVSQISGADGFIRKPFDLEQVKSSINKVIH
jgi:CheY-like chemotaxis protein